jgi:hypothetical protein
MNKKISAVLIGAAFAFSAVALAQTSSPHDQQSQQGQGDPQSSVTSPQTTTSTPQDTTGLNNNSGARAGALNSGAAGNQAGLSDGRNGAFDALDKNHQGYLRETDVASNKQLSTRFKTCDLNKDGRLDREEYDACIKSDSADRY